MNRLATIRNHKNEISRKVALKLRECTAFMKEHGLFKGGIGDIETISDELWKELWLKFIDSTDPLVKKFNKELIPPFGKQENEVLANIKKHPPTEAAITDKRLRLAGKPMRIVKAPLTATQERFIDLWMFDRKKWAKEFAEVGVPNITGGVFTGGTSALDAVESTIPFSIAETETAKFISTQSLKYAKDIGETTEKILRTKLTAALQSGDSVVNVTRKIKGDVKAIYTFSKQSRAKMIAQTEMIGAVNKGSLEGSKQSGVVWGNQWLSALDDLVRDDHNTVHGENAALGDNFPIVDIEYPGDSSGDAEQVINCFPAGTNIILSSDIENITRRWYEGDLIELITSSGIYLAGTPNHPVLTEDGWIPLNLIKKGNNIISTCRFKEMQFSYPYKQNKPIVINEIFRLGSVFGNCQRAGGGYNQFHGDGRTSNVDIISINSKLQSILNTSVFNPFRKNNLAFTQAAEDILEAGGSFTEVGICPCHASHSIMGSIGKTHSFSSRSSGHTHKHGITSIANMDPRFSEPQSDNCTDSIKRFCNRLLGFSRNITVENVINIKIKPYTGHVYNLQTKSGWYVANNIQNIECIGKGIITKNCRCTLKPLTKKPK